MIIRLGKSIAGMQGENRFCCPFCMIFGKDKDFKYHLYVNIDKKVFHCFRCGVSGYINGDGDFYLKGHNGEKYATDLFSDRVDVDLSQYEKTMPKKKQENNQEDVYNVLKYPRLYEVEGVVGKIARKYWQSRGFTRKDSIGFDIRLSEKDSRIIIPVKDLHGTPVFHIGRAIDVSMNPKYFFSKGADKKNYLYNLHNAKIYNEIFMFEGNLDVVSVGHNAIALMGKFLSKGQVDQLKQTSIQKIYLMLDSDVGKREMVMVKEQLRMIVDVRVLDPPKEGDMNDLLIKKGRDEVNKYLKDCIEETS